MVKARILRGGPLLAGVALCWLLGTALPAGPEAAPSPMSPDTAVREFFLPRFGPDGNRSWDLAGSQGTYVSPREIEVSGMRLRIFEPGRPEAIQLQIESPQARLFLEESRAVGPGFLLVLAPTFSLSGRNWTWEGFNRTIRIQAEARVAFAEDLSDILR